ncbi:hypothetical protein C8R44DRAFT_941436 [Mycena epipterygia]|nr:hypothetical protein C8R44DRAFT_941436 [Mycena epipterygia]
MQFILRLSLAVLMLGYITLASLGGPLTPLPVPTQPTGLRSDEKPANNVHRDSTIATSITMESKNPLGDAVALACPFGSGSTCPCCVNSNGDRNTNAPPALALTALLVGLYLIRSF